jgi:hypothetical protein
LPLEEFRISPRARRERRYELPSYRLDPLLATPVKPPTRKKAAKSDAVRWEEEEKREERAVAKGGFRLEGNERKDVRPGRYRVDEGTAVFRMGGKTWRVSVGGEFYVPAGEEAVLASCDGQRVAVTELSR